jgi:hypothetical protein
MPGQLTSRKKSVVMEKKVFVFDRTKPSCFMSNGGFSMEAVRIGSTAPQ